MQMIRMAWFKGLHPDWAQPNVPEGSNWERDTPERRAFLEQLIINGNSVHGTATHWLEEKS